MSQGNPNNDNDNGESNQGQPENINDTERAGPPDKVLKRKERAKRSAKQRELEELSTEKVSSYLQKAQQAEKQADIEQMSIEDKMQFYYMKAIIEVLKKDYDILISADG
jgi:hypothetical protein